MTRRSILPAAGACVALVALLGGCGKSEPTSHLTPDTPVKAPESGKTVSAEDVARQARGDLSCPARVGTPPRADGAPVDDVLGVRPGLSYEEAVDLVLCTQPLLVATKASGRGFNLKVPQAETLRQGFTARPAEPRVGKTSKQIMKELQDEMQGNLTNRVREDLKPGQTKWFVSTMGLQGQERVLSVAREERFAADQNPTVDAVREALVKKYGAPTREQLPVNGQMASLRWVYDPQGRPVPGTVPLANSCYGTSDPDGGAHLSSDCGIVVQALLIPTKANPALVDRLQVGVVDQAGGYRLITATERGLGQADEQRRAQEVERAAKNTKAPSL